ncbi:MAG: RDD family protein, partial [Acidobacteriaceae bacterium]
MSSPPADVRSPSPREESAPSGERKPLPSWKSEAQSRISAHRARGSKVADNQPVLPGMEIAVTPSSIAARVAERYARIPSHREMLARQTAAASPAVDSMVEAAGHSAPVPGRSPGPSREPVQQELLRYSVSSDSLPATPVTPLQARIPATVFPHLAQEPSDPFEEAVVEPASPLPARLIENPRELVAPRKARPRLAEGPLREEDRAAGVPPAAEPRESGSATTSAGAAPEDDSPPPRAPVRSQWLSIRLDSEANQREDRPSGPSGGHGPLHVAPFEDRTMAALVDIGIVAAAFLLFVGVFAFSTTHFPAGRIALVGAAAILLTMGLLYQYLFFTLTDATPGMRYARIAL